jgi:hypothetical protein
VSLPDRNLGPFYVVDLVPQGSGKGDCAPTRVFRWPDRRVGAARQEVADAPIHRIDGFTCGPVPALA